MRLPDVLGVLGALAVGAVLAVILLIGAVAAPPTLPTPVPPTIPPLPTPTAAAIATPGLEPGQTATPGHIIGIGQPAPPLRVTLTDGSLFDAADYAGQPLWINFMATWTPQSIDELPLMETYQLDLQGKLTVVVVDVGESRQVVRPYMQQLDVDLPVGLDEDTAIQREWGAYALPVHLFIDGDGVIQDILYGGAPLEIWDEALSKIVPDLAPVESAQPGG